jgi:thioredoxin reductase
VRDAAHLSSMGARVILLAEAERLTTERALHDVEVHHGARVESIDGAERVERVVFSTGSPRDVQEIEVAGIAVRIGLEPNTDWLADMVELDSERRIPVDARADTELRFVLAAGDIRSGTSQTVAGAVADGRQAAARASELLGQIA